MKKTNMIHKMADGTKRTALVLLAAGVLMTSAPAFAAPAENQAVVSSETKEAKEEYTIKVTVDGQYEGHDILKGAFGNRGYIFKYSDGFFEKDPVKYQDHLATMSMNMTKASDTYIEKGDYSNGAKEVKAILKAIGFTNIVANEDYLKKPTSDSMGAVAGMKRIKTRSGVKTVVSLTMRSSSYEKEWASNVTLGTNGEAKGFSESADKATRFLFNYLSSHGLLFDAERGNVIFWIQGYSRGGAVANLTARRIIDRYQPRKDAVYAYCLEAPQGGVASEEREDRDYRSIHNVINPDDLVPYVAPTSMGFKRYGVDHYLTSASADENDLHSTNSFRNNLADNYDSDASPERMELVRKQIRQMIPKVSDQTEVMPYKIKTMKLNVRSVSIEEAKDQQYTSAFLNNFVTGLHRKYGKDFITRRDYAANGLQDAARNLMIFLNNGGKISDAKSCVGFWEVLFAFDDMPIGTIIRSVNVNYRGGFWETLVDIIRNNSDNITYTLDLSDNAKKAIVDALVDAFFSKARFGNDDINANKDKVFEKYPGGLERAKKDVRILLNSAMLNINEIDRYITFGYNVKKIMNNHSMTQTMAWLRSYDSWYEGSKG